MSDIEDMQNTIVAEDITSGNSSTLSNETIKEVNLTSIITQDTDQQDINLTATSNQETDQQDINLTATSNETVKEVNLNSITDILRIKKSDYHFLDKYRINQMRNKFNTRIYKENGAFMIEGTKSSIINTGRFLHQQIRKKVKNTKMNDSNERKQDADQQDINLTATSNETIKEVNLNSILTEILRIKKSDYHFLNKHLINQMHKKFNTRIYKKNGTFMIEGTKSSIINTGRFLHRRMKKKFKNTKVNGSNEREDINMVFISYFKL